jgi:hypothetical protein
MMALMMPDRRQVRVSDVLSVQCKPGAVYRLQCAICVTCCLCTHSGCIPPLTMPLC